MRLSFRSPLARGVALVALVVSVAPGSATAIAAAAAGGEGVPPPALTAQPPVALPTPRAPAATPRTASSPAPRVPSRPAPAELPATGGEPIFVALTGLVLLLTGVTLRAASTPRRHRTTLRGA